MSKLLDIQQKYYNLIHDYLDEYYNYMLKNNYTFLETYAKVTKDIFPFEGYIILTSFNEDLTSLWDNNYSSVINEVKRFKGIRTHNFYVPDIHDVENFGKNGKNNPYDVINRVGLYSDTIMLDDPMWRATVNIRDYELIYRFYKFLFYGFKIIEMEKIIFAEIEQPITMVIPSKLGDENSLKILEDIVLQQRLEYVSSLFNIQFASDNDFQDFLSKKVKSIDDFIKLTKQNYEKHKGFIEDVKNIYGYKTTGFHIKGDYTSDGFSLKQLKDCITPDIFDGYSKGFISYCNQMFFKSQLVDAYPLFTKQSVWESSSQFLTDKYLGANDDQTDKDQSYYYGLNVLTQDCFKWLGNIPIEVLIKLRQDGELSNFRLIINENLNKYRTAKIDNLDEIAKDINYELSNLFKQHERTINEIHKKFKTEITVDAVKLATSGLIGIIGAAYPPVGVLAQTCGGIMGSATVYDVINKYKEKKFTLNELKGRPISFLFDAYNTN